MVVVVVVVVIVTVVVVVFFGWLLQCFFVVVIVVVVEIVVAMVVVMVVWWLQNAGYHGSCYDGYWSTKVACLGKLRIEVSCGCLATGTIMIFLILRQSFECPDDELWFKKLHSIF